MDENQNFSLKEIRVAKCDFYISTRNGKNDEVSKGLNLREMIFLGKSMVQHAIDLSIETIVKDNRQIFDLLETLRIMDAIRNVRLSNIVRKVKRYCVFLVPSTAKLQSRRVKCEQLGKLVHE